MTFRRSGFSTQGRGSRRVVDWGFGVADANSIVSATGKLLWGTSISNSGQKITIVRTRGIATLTLLSGAAIGDGYHGAHGICLVTEDALAVGVTALPDPFADSNSDVWLWHSFFDVRLVTATIADGANAMSVRSVIEIDSKAMRKNFDSEMKVVGMSGFIESGTATVELNATTRQLVKI